MEEAASIVHKEVIIGTSDDVNHAFDSSCADGTTALSHECTSHQNEAHVMAESAPEPPAIATVEEHIARLRRELLFGTSQDLTQPASSDSAQLRFMYVMVRADELQRVALLADLLDQIQYWAIEESSTFLEEPSNLAEAEAPEVVYACLASHRPKLVTAALKVVKHMLPHPQTRSELLRVVCAYGMVRVGASSCSSYSMPALAERYTCFAESLAHLLHDFPGMEELVAETVACAHALVRQCESADAVLHSALVAEVLAALEWHYRSQQVQTQALRFLSELAAKPRACVEATAADADTDGPTAEEVPVAVLFCHVGTVLPAVTAALLSNWSCLDIRRPALRFARDCAAFPQNRLSLLQHGVYALAMRAFTEADYTVDVYRDAAETLGHLIPMLDGFQRRSLLLAVRRVLVKRPEAEVLSVALALLYVLLVTLMHKQHETKGSDHEANSIASHSAYAAYMMYPQPPRQRPQSKCWKGEEQSVDNASPSVPNAKGREVRLSLSDVMQALNDRDTVQFIGHLCIPQLVMHITDYYAQQATAAQASGETVEEKGEATLRSLADRCLHMCLGLHC